MNLEDYRRILANEALTFVLSPRPPLAPERPRCPCATSTARSPPTWPRWPTAGAAMPPSFTAKGRMEGDLFIARHGADFYLDAVPVLRESLGLRLEKYLIADDATFEDIGDAWSPEPCFRLRISSPLRRAASSSPATASASRDTTSGIPAPPPK